MAIPLDLVGGAISCSADSRRWPCPFSHSPVELLLLFDELASGT